MLTRAKKISRISVVFGNLIEVKVSFVTPKYDELFFYQEPIMTEHALSSQESYDPNRLLDTLLERMNLKNDAALSRMLEVAPPVISKIRHRRLPVGASLLIRMHEVSDLSIRDLRYLMGDRRNKFRISDKQFKPKEPAGEKANEQK